MRATVSKQKFDYSFCTTHVLGLEDQFSATEDDVVHLKVCLHLIRFNVLLKPVSEPVPSEAY